jgi:hypothetical protein
LVSAINFAQVEHIEWTELVAAKRVQAHEASALHPVTQLEHMQLAAD